MIAMIFEVRPHTDRADRYFELAAALREELEETDDFLSVERFESLTEDGKFLSLSFWRDHNAVDTRYRHAGFADYRIRVAEVFRDYDMAAGRPV